MISRDASLPIVRQFPGSFRIRPAQLNFTRVVSQALASMQMQMRAFASRIVAAVLICVGQINKKFRQAPQARWIADNTNREQVAVNDFRVNIQVPSLARTCVVLLRKFSFHGRLIKLLAL